MNIKKNYNLSEINGYKVPIQARYCTFVESKEDIHGALQFFHKEKIEKLLVVGQGTNILFSDDYFDGLVVVLREGEAHNNVNFLSGGVVEVYGGVVLGNLIDITMDKGLIGLEWAGGLPGTVGAAVRGNVGAFGGEISQNVIEAQVIELSEKTLKQHGLSRDQLNFSYRNSVIKTNKNLLITDAKFQLRQGGAIEIAEAKKVKSDNINYRKIHHPLEFPNCGSVFKNITQKKIVNDIITRWPECGEKVEQRWHGKVPMGYIIERLGLSTHRIGGAEISARHGNFIVNTGKATGRDILSLVQFVQSTVKEKLGFIPEVEIEIIGA